MSRAGLLSGRSRFLPGFFDWLDSTVSSVSRPRADSNPPTHLPAVPPRCDPHGAPNLLTGAATDTWKAIRRAVAVSFSTQNIKKKYPLIISRINELVSRVSAQGPEASIDVDQAALRVTLDVIGLAGFGHDYQSVKQDKPAYDHLLRVLPRCFTEVMLRVANPVRQALPSLFKNGDKGESKESSGRLGAVRVRLVLWRQTLCGFLQQARLVLPTPLSPPRSPPIQPPNPRPRNNQTNPGSKAYDMFQAEMRILLQEMKERGPPPAGDQDIASQLYRVMKENPEVTEERVISEIGILFVEGFETTGEPFLFWLRRVLVGGWRGERERRAAAESGESAGQWIQPKPQLAHPRNQTTPAIRPHHRLDPPPRRHLGRRPGEGRRRAGLCRPPLQAGVPAAPRDGV